MNTPGLFEEKINGTRGPSPRRIFLYIHSFEKCELKCLMMTLCKNFIKMPDGCSERENKEGRDWTGQPVISPVLPRLAHNGGDLLSRETVQGKY